FVLHDQDWLPLVQAARLRAGPRFVGVAAENTRSWKERFGAVGWTCRSISLRRDALPRVEFAPILVSSPIICFGQQPCGIFPRRFLFSKIQTARHLQRKIGG